jgi:PAS domain S-box-containing protein
MKKSKSGRLLIVDDEIDLLTSLCDILSEIGYETVGFTSGKDALKALNEQDFDLLLTDLMMPEMDGIALLRAALEMDPHLVGIIITGQGTIHTAVEAIKVGAFDYVLKPFRLKSLAMTLTRAMRLRQLKESEEKYRSIVEDQTELIRRFLPGGTLTFVNEAYCRYFGKKREELLGDSFMKFIPDEDHEQIEKHFMFINRENPVAKHEHRVIKPDGEICWQQWTDRAMFDKHGNLAEYQSVGSDITERKRMEKELRKRVEDLERFYDMAVGRELKIKEMKNEIESLKGELSKYKRDEDKG